MKLPLDLERRVASAGSATVTADMARRAIGMLDLTSLNDGDDDAAVSVLCHRALTLAGPVAAVCVWPRFVALARRELADTTVKVATVVSFPRGEDAAGEVREATRAARQAGADEIDVVFPYRAFLDGERARPREVLAACREATGDGVLKVILETGAFTDADLLSWAARDALHAGADFLKTSTGKIAQGATPEAVALLLDVAQGSGRAAGVKVSGGVRDAESAALYLRLADESFGAEAVTAARFRFGASGLLDRLLAALGHGGPAGAGTTGY